MRKMLWAFGLLAAAVIAWHYPATYAQSASTTTQTVRLAGGVVTVESRRTSILGNGSAFSDGVVLAVNGVRIAADRAVVEVQDNAGEKPEEIKLEGNVRLSFPKRP